MTNAGRDEPPDRGRPEPSATGHRPELWVVRHGETEWARDLRHTGRTDVPLTDVGRAEARSVGPALAGVGFELVLSSPRTRALDTARLAGFGDRAEVDPDLAEWDYGGYEGLTTPEIRVGHPGWTVWLDGAAGGESPDQVAARADRVIRRLETANGRVLVFGHGQFLRVLAARWLGLAASEGRLFALDTATVSVLGWERDSRVIERWNVDPRP